MRYVAAWMFKIIFKVRYFRRYYFAFYKRLFKPYHLFKGVSLECKYNDTLRIKADLEDWIQQNIFFTGVYDQNGLDFIKTILKEGDTFIDIGANIGCFTLVGAQIVGNSGRVIAFEPVDIVSKKLEQNITLNRLVNVCIEKKAVFENNGVLQLHLANQENLGMSSVNRHDSESGVVINVEAVSLDEYLKYEKIDEIKLIKIDIEGAELYALRGMETTLSEYKPVLIVEVSPEVTKSSEERLQVFNYLIERNYERFVIQDDGELIQPDDQNLIDHSNFVFIHKS